MSLLSVEKKSKERFVLVREVNGFGVFLRLSSHIMGCRLDGWEDLMEYMVRETGNI